MAGFFLKHMHGFENKYIHLTFIQWIKITPLLFTTLDNQNTVCALCARFIKTSVLSDIIMQPHFLINFAWSFIVGRIAALLSSLSEQVDMNDF